MAFDWTQIDGYREDMTGEEKLALLDGYEPKSETYWKNQHDKLSTELASMKKRERERMSEDEKREADRAAADAAKDEELKSLRREKALNAYKAQYLAQGYDAKLAEQAATGMVDGDPNAVFEALNKYRQAMETKLRSDILKDTPKPPSGDSGSGLTDAEKFAKRMGETKAAADKTARDTLAQYY